MPKTLLGPLLLKIPGRTKQSELPFQMRAPTSSCLVEHGVKFPCHPGFRGFTMNARWIQVLLLNGQEAFDMKDKDGSTIFLF